MAFFSRYKSAPQLHRMSGNTSIVLNAGTPSDEEYTEASEGVSSEREDGENMIREKPSFFAYITNTTQSHKGTSLLPAVSEFNDASEVMLRKTRLTPVLPGMSSRAASRHSYACELDVFGFQASSSIESTASDSKLVYQTSTDSDSVSLEPGRGSNFPGELAGADNLYTHTALGDRALAGSPRSRSRLIRLREAFRSPQIGRKKALKQKSDEDSSPRLRKARSEDGTFVKMKKSKTDGWNKSPNGSFEPIPEMSDTVIALGYELLVPDQEFEVTRITDYGKYLSDLLEETNPSHPDFENLSNTLTKVNSMVKEKEDELCEEESRSEMDPVVDRSLHDDLNLNITSYNSSSTIGNITNINNNEDQEKYSNKPKGLAQRRMSAPSGLLFKSLAGYRSKNSPSLWNNNNVSKRDNELISQFKMAEGESSRTFVMEGSVQFATGMQTQERYLFLFNDLLLVTKQKSNTVFKLKHRVLLCDMWMASCIEEVAETTRPSDRSFVIGWPIVNVVATFPRPDIKDQWLNKLTEYIQLEKLKDQNKQLQLKVAPRDIESNTIGSCQVTISNLTEAKDVLLACLQQLNISEHETRDYQLWVLSGKEGSPYPLIGHETPFSIKLSNIRVLSRSRSGDNLDNMTAADLDLIVNNSTTTGQKCEFYLKQKKTRKNNFEDSGFSKSLKKNKKSANIFHNIFRKRRPVQHLVFGLPLSEVCDENLEPPEAIIKLMVLVYQQGPNTPGILRRGNKATLSKEIREKIDSGDKYTLEEHMAPTAASVFKEFLRSIPEGLLVNDLYIQWATIKKDDLHGEKIHKIKTILAKLPPTHYWMIKLTISLLQHLAKHSSRNQMGPSNLATCIAPSFYTCEQNASHGNLKGEALKQKQMQNTVFEIQSVIVPLISFMIINHVDIFGDDVLNMFTRYGCEASPAGNLFEDRPEIQTQPSLEEDEENELVGEGEQDDGIDFGRIPNNHHRLQLQQQQEHMQRDSTSGTDSDSMHSVLSMQETEMGLRHNDSSIDSLVDREFYAESSPKAVKSHISPSNLSRDSGLTLSDTQLYDEEACHGDTVTASTKIYQRSTSHFIDRENGEAYDHNSYQFSRSVNPKAPPRKRVTRKGRDSNDESDGEQHGFTAYFNQRAPFMHSASATQLNNDPQSCGSGELRPLLSHPLLSKRVSSDSIGEEDEIPDNQRHPVDFGRMRARTDIGTVVKSENGSQLFLNDLTVPTKYYLNTPGSKSQRRFVRQSSVTDSTPPISPQSRYSQSSHDSIISDSVCSVSRDGSIHSAPQTPDELQAESLVWVPDINIPNKSGVGQLFNHNSNHQNPLVFSKSTSDNLSASKEDESNANNYSVKCGPKVKPFLSTFWPGESHAAEGVEIGSGPHFRHIRSEHSSNPSSSPSHNNLPYRKHGIPVNFDKGSPPPNVIIQALQSLPKKDSAPAGSSPPYSEFSGAGFFDQSMSSVRYEEYRNVTPKAIIIEPPVDTLASSSSTASRRARLSKYMSSSVDLPLSSKNKDIVPAEHTRPDKPPQYQQALERNFIIKHNMPLNNTTAKTEHEYIKGNSEQKSAAKCLESQSSSEKEPSNQTNKNCTECSNCTETPENRHTSGYLDKSCISSSIQKDVLGGYCTHTESAAQSHSKHISSTNTISNSDSKFSHSTSSNGSSVPVSTPTKHSAYSIQNDNRVTVSSRRDSDITSKTGSTVSKSRSVTDLLNYHNIVDNRHFCPVKPESNSQADTNNEVMVYEDDVSIKKDPEQLYLQSMQMYEQKHSATRSASNISMKKSLTSPSPFPNSHQQKLSDTTFMPHRKTSSTLPSQATLTPKGKPNESLYKSRSYSVEHLNQVGVYSPLSTRSGRETLMYEQNRQQSGMMSYDDKSHDTKTKSLHRDIKLELHQNFIRARSCFDQSENDLNTSPAFSGQQLTHHSSSQDNRIIKSLSQPVASAATTEDMTVESALLPGFRTKASSKAFNHPKNHVSEHKKEIHWSVKDLKSIYDRSKDISGSSKDLTSQSSSQPRSPPPYQNPPPFRNTQDSFILNTATSDSGDSNHLPIISKTSSKMVDSHKLGPQNYFHDAFNSYSSSEDGYSSSLDQHSTRSGDCSQENESLSDYTNITYV